MFSVNIWYLRYIAAFTVVVYHLNGTLLPQESIQSYNKHLSAGVDLFFVISGYLMAVSVCHSNHNILTFFWQRYRRIYPLFLALTLALVAFDYLADIFPQRSFTNIEIFHSLTFSSMFSECCNQIVAVAWTLEYEVVFYGFVALSFLLKTALARLIFIILSISILSIYTGYSVFLEFIFGILVFSMMYLNRYTSLFTISILVIALYFTDVTIDSRIIMYGLPMTIIFAVSFLMNRFVSFVPAIPNLSYEIYLFHIYVVKVVGSLGSDTGVFKYLILLTLTISVSFLLSVAWNTVASMLLKKAL